MSMYLDAERLEVQQGWFLWKEDTMTNDPVKYDGHSVYEGPRVRQKVLRITMPRILPRLTYRKVMAFFVFAIIVCAVLVAEMVESAASFQELLSRGPLARALAALVVLVVAGYLFGTDVGLRKWFDHRHHRH